MTETAGAKKRGDTLTEALIGRASNQRRLFYEESPRCVADESANTMTTPDVVKRSRSSHQTRNLLSSPWPAIRASIGRIRVVRARVDLDRSLTPLSRAGEYNSVSREQLAERPDVSQDARSLSSSCKRPNAMTA